MVSHEYGTQTLRPHHHCIIFGWQPNNQKLLKYSKSGHALFTSPDLNKLWTNGFHSIGEANEKTAYYIASYALKGKKHNLLTPSGEYIDVCDTFDCSKLPAIGLNYFKKYHKQLLANGEILPRYYQKKLADLYPELLEEYENKKLERIKNRGSQERLAKYVINEKTKSMADGEFRTQSEDNTVRDYKNYLKSEVKMLKEHI